MIEATDQGRRRTDRENAKQIILMTSLLDVPAEIVAAVYRLRWSIELFFRFFKHLLGCHRLLSQKSQGVTIQIYCALIACLLLAQATGGSVGRRAFDVLCLYLQGWADESEVLDVLARIRRSEAARRQRS